MANSIIEGLVDYFSACPLLKKGCFRVDSLGTKGVEYEIDVGVNSPVSVRYIDGSTERICNFNFESREYYSLDRATNIANSKFYEEFAEWVEEQEEKNSYPDLPKGCEPRKIECLSPGFLYSTDMKTARYQIQLRLTYFKEA